MKALALIFYSLALLCLSFFTMRVVLVEDTTWIDAMFIVINFGSCTASSNLLLQD